MAVKNITILSTRNVNKELTNKAALQDIYIEVIPFIKTLSDTSDKTVKHIRDLAEKPLNVIFTSSNAVEAVKTQLSSKPPWKIFCTGGATKEILLRFFDEAAIVASAKNATLLAEKILQHSYVKELVFFCGNQRLNDLPENLKASNVQVEEAVVYQTIETPVMISKSYQGILFFSPSAANSFFSENTISVSTVLFSIGKTTTATLESYCSNQIITSQWPGEASMFDLVIDYFK